MAQNELWTTYRVRWDFITQLCGSVPADPEIIEQWVRARQPKVRPAGARSFNEIQNEVISALESGEAEDKPEYSILTFQRFPIATALEAGQLVMRAATVRAHLKDCARVMSAQYWPKVKGERAFSTRVINGLYPAPTPYWIPILRPDGTPVMKHDGERDKAIHVRGPRGEQQNAIKRFEWVEPARMDFTLRVLGESIREEDLRLLLEYGGIHGYAGERSDGEGKYTFSLTKET